MEKYLMNRYFTMHPDNPQPRLVRQAAEIIAQGGLIAYLTDSGYAFGCGMESREALTDLRRLRGLTDKHPLTLLCPSVSQASKMAYVDDKAFHILKRYTPGPYTFILRATKQVPKLIQGVKRRVVGIRIPSHPLAQALAEAIDEPILSSTLWLSGDEAPLSDPMEIFKRTENRLALVLDAGIAPDLPSSVVDLTEDPPLVVRQGLGDTSEFE